MKVIKVLIKKQLKLEIQLIFLTTVPFQLTKHPYPVSAEYMTLHAKL